MSITPEQQAQIDKFVEERRRYKVWLEARAMRNRRDGLLARTDWTQTADCPLPADEVQAWAEYRQSLREYPEQEGFPYIPLPTPPDDLDDPRVTMNGEVGGYIDSEGNPVWASQTH